MQQFENVSTSSIVSHLLVYDFLNIPQVASHTIFVVVLYRVGILSGDLGRTFHDLSANKGDDALNKHCSFVYVSYKLSGVIIW